jgi:hypothetical protein
MNTDTPRTDAEAINKHVIRSNRKPECAPYVSAFFARTLERELAQAQERIRELEKALKEIANYGGGSGLCDYGCDTPSIAISALNAKQSNQ